MLQGKKVVITGCASGIGFSIVKRFAENHADIFAFVHHITTDVTEQFREISRHYSVNIKVVEAEMSDMDSIRRAFVEILKGNESIDILVNNAAVGCEKTLGMTSVDELEYVMKVNYVAPSYIMQVVSRKMIRNKAGIIINICSRAGVEPRSGVYAYGASKAALIWATKAVARELAPYSIRVNGIAPGLTDTKMGAKNRSVESIEKYIEGNNIKRPALPDEIADVVLFLATDNSSYISGQVISVDGGRM